MSGAAFEPFRSDHLFVLVGGNPLPNCVAVRLLVKPEGTVYLVHSDETAEIALRLKQRCLRHELVHVPRSDGPRIRQCIEERRPAQGSVGLHYTGGTKTMAAHAYQAVRKWPQSLLSYLDAKDKTLWLERGDVVETLRLTPEAVVLNIAELLQVQGASTVVATPTVVTASYCELLSLLRQVYCVQTARGAYQEWLRRVLEPACFRDANRRRYSSESTLAALSLELPAQPGLEPLRDWLHDGTDSSFSLAKAAAKAGLGSNERFCRALRGTWLEHLVWSILELRGPLQIADLLQSQQVEIHGRRAELDVLAIRGYQLYAVSCTTDDERGMAKLKLFEALVRARQVGGDEANVALVACFPSSGRELEHEAAREWQAQARLRVFAIPELPALEQELESWFLED